MEEKLALGRIDELLAGAKAHGDKVVIAQVVPNMSPAALKSIAENIKSREGNTALLLVSPQGHESVSVVSAFSPALVKRGLQRRQNCRRSGSDIGRQRRRPTGLCPGRR